MLTIQSDHTKMLTTPSSKLIKLPYIPVMQAFTLLTILCIKINPLNLTKTPIPNLFIKPIPTSIIITKINTIKNEITCTC